MIRRWFLVSGLLHVITMSISLFKLFSKSCFPLNAKKPHRFGEGFGYSRLACVCRQAEGDTSTPTLDPLPV